MKTYSILAIAMFMFSFANAQQSKSGTKTIQMETIIIDQSDMGSTTIEINEKGVYVDGQRVATRDDLRNPNINKSIIINQGGRQAGQKAMLGVYADPTSSYKGAYIQDVSPNSAADKAGLQEGDLITWIDTTAIYSADDLIRVIKEYQPGDKVVVKFRRNGKGTQTTAKLMATTDAGSLLEKFRRDDFFFPDIEKMDQKPKLGITVEDMADGQGVRIINVNPDSPADLAGLRRNDVVRMAGAVKINNVNELERLVNKLEPGSTLKFEVIRGDTKLSRTLNIPKPRIIKYL